MKLLFVLLFTVLTFSVSAHKVDKKEPVKKYTQEEWDKMIKEKDKDCWNMRIKMTYPGLPAHYKAVLVTLVTKDPMENFKEELKGAKDYFTKTTDLEDGKHMNVNIAWNSIFDTVKGGQVSLVVNTDENDQKVGLSWGGNNFEKQWLVTKAFGVNGKTIVWSIPVNKKKGKETKIVLTPKNAIDNAKLEKIYDSIIK